MSLIDLEGLDWCGLGGRRVIAVLRVALDKSESASALELTSVAGYLAPIDDWNVLQPKWECAINYFGIPYFHERKLADWLDEHTAGLCLKHFRNHICDSKLYGVGGIIILIIHDNPPVSR